MGTCAALLQDDGPSQHIVTHRLPPEGQGAMSALTIGGHAATAPEDGAVEEADEQRHEHAHEVVGGAAPVRQPKLAR